jgi:hypothetical protein
VGKSPKKGFEEESSGSKSLPPDIKKILESKFDIKAIPNIKDMGTPHDDLRRTLEEHARTLQEHMRLLEQISAPLEALRRKSEVDIAALREENKRLLSLLEDANRVNDSLVRVLASRDEQRLRMFESYAGLVEEVQGDQVVVRYLVNGDVVEQTYEQSQFQGGHLPKVGDHLVVQVYLTEASKQGVDQETIQKALVENDQPNALRKPITGPLTF